MSPTLFIAMQRRIRSLKKTQPAARSAARRRAALKRLVTRRERRKARS